MEGSQDEAVARFWTGKTSKEIQASVAAQVRRELSSKGAGSKARPGKVGGRQRKASPARGGKAAAPPPVASPAPSLPEPVAA